MAQLPTGAFTPKLKFAMIEREDKSKLGPEEANVPAQLFLDITISEDHGFEADITDFPVESGGTISDNIRLKPITVTIEGLVSNTPLDEMAALRGDNEQAAEKALAFLMSVWESRETVTLRTSLGTFKKMAMSSLNVPRNKDIGDALRFTARFQQITTVTIGRTKAAVRKRTGGGGKKDPKKDLGTQPVPQKLTGQTYWNKGVVPVASGGFILHGGSAIVLETEIVYWSRFVDARDSEQALNNDSATPTNGQWFHSDKVTPLDPIDIVHLKKDLARDARRRANQSLAPVDLEFMENQRKAREVQDLNKISKAKAQHVERGNLPGIVPSARVPLR